MIAGTHHAESGARLCRWKKKIHARLQIRLRMRKDQGPLDLARR